MSGVSRRGLLGAGGLVVGAAGVAGLVGTGVLPGEERVARLLGWCGELPAPPKVASGPVKEHVLRRVAGGGAVRAVVGWPPGVRPGDPLAVAVMLHGGGGDARTPYDVYAVHRYLADAARRGVPPFAVASVDAVDGWTGPGANVIVDELLPYLSDQGLRTGRFGLLGWSMGGDGALALATRLGSGRIAALVATSPAITSESAAAYAARLRDIPVWAGCGSSDGFAGATEDLLTALREAGAKPEGGISPGCHDAVFRRRMLPEQLAFLGPLLSRPA